MSSEKKLANAVGAKTARACENCIRKRARWYCAADDAFLCQYCDSSVHSANPLARKHERVLLKTSSFKSSNEFANLESSNSVTSWHNGFTRKSRTPRNGKSSRKVMSIDEEEIENSIHLVVPEILSDENSQDENELICRVPTLYPNNGNEYSNEMKNDFSDYDMNRFHGMLNIPSEMELEEFAADVESLLRKGLDDGEVFNYMEGLGFMEDCVKVENEGEVEIDMASTTSYDNQVDYSEIDMAGETFELKFDYDSPIITFEEDINNGEVGEIVMNNNNIDVGKSNTKILLNLDCRGVLNAWDDQRSPWTTGERPELDSDDCWPVSMENCGKIHSYEHMGIMKGHALVDEGREARVLRYRDKRRTRLFSKKIRYEVRKLNAEKRPRMKGSFVKRANFAAAPIPFHK